MQQAHKRRPGRGGTVSFVSERHRTDSTLGALGEAASERIRIHDSVTLLTTRGPLATKRFTAAGDGIATEGYGNAKHFRVDQIPVGSLAELADTLDRLQTYRRSFLVRGEPLEGIDRARSRRLAYPDTKAGAPATLREQARRWLLLDFDSVEGAPCDPLAGAAGAAWLRERLPASFHAAACWWAHSSSAGIKPGLRMRLGFWLSRPLAGDECGRLLATAPVDHALFRLAQPIYVAAPIFVDMPDPVACRTGRLDGAPAVEPGAIPPPPAVTVVSVKWCERKKLSCGSRGAPGSLLERACAAITGTPPAGMNPYGGGGRHHALYCAALACSWLIKTNRFRPSEVIAGLADAALAVGIDDRAEIARTIRNGLVRGGAL